MSALGIECDDEPGRFGPGTVAAVRAFQLRRGLTVDGVCGRETWSSLVEAGYRLGDRLLYLRQPMLRGDDVAALQQRMGSLGFDAGRVDGMFGARTAAALEDVQRNLGLTVDGVCGPATVAALDRLGARCEQSRPVVEAVRELERLRAAPRTLVGWRLMVGHTGGLDVLVDSVAKRLRGAGASVAITHHPDGSEQAAAANSAGAGAFIALGLRGDEALCTTSYYARSDYESAGGRHLAELVQAAVPKIVDAADGGVRGMSIPILRETRMPTVLTELGPASAVVERTPALAAALTAALSAWAAAPAD